VSGSKRSTGICKCRWAGRAARETVNQVSLSKTVKVISFYFINVNYNYNSLVLFQAKDSHVWLEL